MVGALDGAREKILVAALVDEKVTWLVISTVSMWEVAKVG